jgi:hypothetical protein
LDVEEDDTEEPEPEPEPELEEVEAEEPEDEEVEPEDEPDEPEEAEVEPEPQPEPIKPTQVPPPQNVEQVDVKYMQKTKPKLGKKIYSEEELRKYTREDLVNIARDMNISKMNDKYTSSAKYNILFAGILQIQNSLTKK